MRKQLMTEKSGHEMEKKAQTRREMWDGKDMCAYDGTRRHLVACYEFSTEVVINEWTEN